MAVQCISLEYYTIHIFLKSNFDVNVIQWPGLNIYFTCHVMKFFHYEVENVLGCDTV